MEVYIDVFIPRLEIDERSEVSRSIFGKMIKLAARPMLKDRIDTSTFNPDNYQDEEVSIKFKFTKIEHTKGYQNGKCITILHVDAELVSEDEWPAPEIEDIHEALTSAGWDYHSIR